MAFSAFNNSLSTDISLTYFILLGYLNIQQILFQLMKYLEKDEFFFGKKNYTNSNFIENNKFGHKLSWIKTINITEIQNNGMEVLDSSNNLIKDNDIISYENNITFKKSKNIEVFFGNYIFMYAG